MAISYLITPLWIGAEVARSLAALLPRDRRFVASRAGRLPGPRGPRYELREFHHVTEFPLVAHSCDRDFVDARDRAAKIAASLAEQAQRARLHACIEMALMDEFPSWRVSSRSQRISVRVAPQAGDLMAVSILGGCPRAYEGRK